MAFYSASPSNNASSSSIPGHTQGQSQNHLPHLAPSGDIGVAQDATAPEVSLKFTEAQVEEYKEQDRYLPVCLYLLSFYVTFSFQPHLSLDFPF
jgi:hypothetical protein